MKCLIDKVIESSGGKRQKAEVIKRYIRMKYRIKLESEVIENRMKQIKQNVSMV